MVLDFRLNKYKCASMVSIIPLLSLPITKKRDYKISKIIRTYVKARKNTNFKAKKIDF